MSQKNNKHKCELIFELVFDESLFRFNKNVPAFPALFALLPEYVTRYQQLDMIPYI